MLIHVTVTDKVATTDGSPVIICGNSDYLISFTFDAEWDAYETKTARFVYVSAGALQYQEVIFTGSTAAVPVLSNVTDVSVGVYAGDLRTTTPARIPCKRSILCNDPVHVDPPRDVYDQLLELLAGISGEGGTTDYLLLSSKPKINGVELVGNLGLADLGIAGKTGNGGNSAVYGDGCTVYGARSLVGGRNSTTSDDNSLLYGLGLVGSGPNQAIFGQYNKYGEGYNVLMQVGNGSGDGVYRSNALTLEHSGNLTISGSLTTGDGKVMTDENYTAAEKAKLASITNPLSIKGRVDTVDDLPAAASVGWLYFVGDAGSGDFAEYVYTTDGAWEQVGVSSVDLSLYYTADETDAAIETATADKLSRSETAAAAVLDGAGNNIAEQTEQTKSDILSAENGIAINRHTLGTQCKNIINNNRTSGTSGGLTITVNEDKSVTFNGTATENVYYWVYGTGVSASSQKKLARGKYILTGCPKGGTQETYSLAVGYRKTPTSERYGGYDIGTGYALNIDSDTGSVDILMQIRTGTIVDNLTFCPMLRSADITDDTYEPYAPSLQEQINALVAEIAELKTQITTPTTAE